MCAISGSLDTDKLKELTELNSYRGSHSHSFSIYDVNNRLLTVSKAFGEIDLDLIKVPEGCYGITHTQAPTTDNRNKDSIHPAAVQDDDRVHCLWHNGIIKNKHINVMQKELNSNDTWDTKLLLMQVIREGVPKDVDGTFSCVLFKSTDASHGDLFLFRNEISPLFIDDDMNISSTKFDGCAPTVPNYMYKMDLKNKLVEECGEFRTVENPYFFGV